MPPRQRVRTADARMPLIEHIRELRKRLFRALLGLTAGTIVAFIFFNPIFDVLKAPYCDLPAAHRLGGSCTLIVTGIFDAFFLKLKVSLLAGSVLSSPVWLYQLWRFITPGLHRNERRWVYAFMGSAVPLFFGGAALAYLTLDHGLALFLGFTPAGVTPLIRVNDYLSYATAMLLIFGFSFEFPLLIVLLNAARVLSATKLASWRRAEIFGVFVFAAVITPSQDPFTMCAMAIPMVILYEVAVLVAKAHDRRVARREAESPYAGLADDAPSPMDLGDLSVG